MHATKTLNRSLVEFMNTVGEIADVLEALRNANDDHYWVMPSQVHWGHVGDAKRTLTGLQEILDVVRGEVK